MFGKVEKGQMLLNDAGKMVASKWLKLTERFKNIELHEYVVMPNHFHAILEIVETTLVVVQDSNSIPGQPQEISVQGQPQGIEIGQPLGQPQGIAPTIAPTETPTKTPTKTLGDILGAFQSIITVEYIKRVKNLGWPPFKGKLLQRNYYEHIIRDERAYENISNYIINNPAKWDEDKFNFK